MPNKSIISAPFPYGNDLNDETELYIEHYAAENNDLSFAYNEPDSERPRRVRRVFLGDVPKGAANQSLTEAQFMANAIGKITYPFDEKLDFMEETSRTTRENVMRTVEAIEWMSVEEFALGSLSIEAHIWCDLLRVPRVKWLFEMYGKSDISREVFIHPRKFRRTDWEIFRELVAFHIFEKAIYKLPAIAPAVEPIRRETLLRKFK